MKCECGAMSTILVEDADGTVTPKCEQCYYDPKFSPDEVSEGLKNIERRSIMEKNKEIDKILRRIQVNAEMIHSLEHAAKRFRVENKELRARLAEIEAK